MPLVHVKPELLRWACERSRKSEDALKGRFPTFDAWMLGQRQPTLKQLEQFAAYTHTPIGYLFGRVPIDVEKAGRSFRVSTSVSTIA
jgi:hypothetical protein